MFRGLFICVIDSPREYSTCFIIVSLEKYASFGLRKEQIQYYLTSLRKKLKCIEYISLEN